MLADMRLSSPRRRLRQNQPGQDRAEELAWVEKAALVVVDEHPVG